MTAVRFAIIHRREFLIGGSSAAALLATLAASRPAAAQDADAKVTQSPAGPAAMAEKPAADKATFDAVFNKLTKGQKPTEGKISVEFPEIAENGNVVPFTVTADSPMTETSHVKAIHILSTENPQPLVSSFRFTPASGKATVAGRMRLAKTQDIVTLAELSDGKLWIARSKVKVTIGGCGG